MRKARVSKNQIDYLLHLLKEELVEEFGEGLKEVILFGSYAREDFSVESDLDLLVVLKELTRETEQRLLEIVHDIESRADFNFIISTIVFDEEGYQMRKGKGSLFLDTAEEEGMVLWKST